MTSSGPPCNYGNRPLDVVFRLGIRFASFILFGGFLFLLVNAGRMNGARNCRRRSAERIMEIPFSFGAGMNDVLDGARRLFCLFFFGPGSILFCCRDFYDSYRSPWQRRPGINTHSAVSERIFHFVPPLRKRPQSMAAFRAKAARESPASSRASRFRGISNGPSRNESLLDFTGFYWVLLRFTRFYWVFYRVLLRITGFYCVLLGFTGFYWVLLRFTGFYWVLLGFTGLCQVLLGFTRFYWVRPGFTEFYWVLLGLTGFYFQKSGTQWNGPSPRREIREAGKDRNEKKNKQKDKKKKEKQKNNKTRKNHSK